MARISISQASKDFKVTRNTIYSWINKGFLTKNANGLIDATDMIRLCSERVEKRSTKQDYTHRIANEQNTTQHQLEQENLELKKLLAMYEIQINQYKEQIEYLKQNEVWLKNQIEQQKLIEHNNKKRGFLSKLLG
jgi:septal ring factor EnvC (AmiA/AmiB activator)